ncbi:hypothetical protein [Noviherbaspirillum pedocola]|uniref:Uncharacterized protein n=1 Tax=Noviherbaspirillum pedocola TaxID=2801341 RepID=A0A934T030_9BURK|nr:hypothetical protein [Noviherbaspirillum pedocola]MBK4738874.1 hypothetical protein [Noviherbaspirillum pedocola]
MSPFPYPFSAPTTPALPDDHRYVGSFGDLPLDILPIVVRSIALGERASLLSLALVNKSMYFATRPQRTWLGVWPERGALQRESSRFQAGTRFQYMLHLAASMQEPMPVDARHALLCAWLDQILPHRHGLLLNHYPDWPLHMLQQFLQAVQTLPAREQGDLLWSLLSALERPVRQQGPEAGAKTTLLLQMKQMDGCLPDEERRAFTIACRVAGWRIESGLFAHRFDHAAQQGEEALSAEHLQAACDAILLHAHALPIAALATTLDVIISHLRFLPQQRREKALASMFEASAAWPAYHRVRILAALLDALRHCDVSPEAADRVIAHMHELEPMLDACAALPEDDKLRLLRDAVCLVKGYATLCEHCSDPAASAAALEEVIDRIGIQLIAHLVALPSSRLPQSVLERTLREAMRTMYGWGGNACKWQQGYAALCAANKLAHGVTYGLACDWMARALFTRAERNRAQSPQEALAALLEQDETAPDGHDEVATWRLFIRIGSNRLDSRRREPDDDSALGDAETLLARPGIMTPAAWVELMGMSLEGIAPSDNGCRLLHRVLQHARTIPETLRAELLARITRIVKHWKPEHQSGVADSLLQMAEALNVHARARLLPVLIELCMEAIPGNRSAQSWLDATMRMIAGLPDAAKYHLLETVLNVDTIASSHAVACAALLSQLEQQIATLPPQPQARLLASLALCLGGRSDGHARRMFEGVMARLNRLDLPPQAKQAWQLVCQAAYLHPRQLEHGEAPQQKIRGDAEALPDPLRQAVHTMLDHIDELPSYSVRRREDRDGTCVLI